MFEWLHSIGMNPCGLPNTPGGEAHLLMRGEQNGLARVHFVDFCNGRGDIQALNRFTIGGLSAPRISMTRWAGGRKRRWRDKAHNSLIPKIQEAT